MEKCIHWPEVITTAELEKDMSRQDGIPFLKHLARQIPDSEDNREMLAYLYQHIAKKPKKDDPLNWVWSARTSIADPRNYLRLLYTQNVHEVACVVATDAKTCIFGTPLEVVNKYRFKNKRNVLSLMRFYNLNGDEACMNVRMPPATNVFDRNPEIIDSLSDSWIGEHRKKGRLEFKGRRYSSTKFDAVLSKDGLKPEIFKDSKDNLIFGYEDGSFAVLLPEPKDKDKG